MRPLVAAPRERVVYSDLGFIALGAVLERSTGRSLSALIARLREELGAESLGYCPSAREIADVPATEEDAWRGRVRGFVHDEKAYLMGGVAGHAGLFGSARDVALLTEAFLGPLCGRPTTLLPENLVRESLVKQAEDDLLGRGLGWMLKKRDDNSCGARMRPGTFGHTGFTGTCAWADPSRDAQVVFLTNGVYFGRSDSRDLRAAVCDAVIEESDAC
jgi:CubicO group peptidase (beta-lactamase class C family)